MKRKNSSPSTTDSGTTASSSPSSSADIGASHSHHHHNNATDSLQRSISEINREARFWGRPLPYPLSKIAQLFHKIFLFEETLSKGVPLFRGKIHLLLVYLAPLWITSLLQCCSSKLSVFAVVLSSACCLFNFTASALLHNRSWSDFMYGIMTKLDYAGIFVMISGCCSPVPILLLSPFACFAFIFIQWTSAIIGISMTLFGQYTDRKNSVRATVYIVMGLSNCVFMKHLFECLTLFEFICLTSLGAFYIIGAIFYARKSPDLWPGVFGYHELFHFCCFAAGVCTFMLNRSVLTRVQLQNFNPSDSLLAQESLIPSASS